MTIDLTRLPLNIGVGATTTYSFDTIVTPSEAGIAARKALRTNCIRGYMVSIGPEDAEEFQSILLSHVGQRYPFAMRDWTNYILTSEVQVHNGTLCPLIRTWAPASGPRVAVQRILVLDTSEVALTLKVNGVVPTSGSYSIDDTCNITFSPPISPSAIVTASGRYLTPVCMVDNPTATVYLAPAAGTSTALYAFPDIRLQEILETELIELTS